jgi:hypothetical protein
MPKTRKKKKEAKDWLDYPENRSRLLRCFYWLCGLIVVVDVVFTLGWHKHAIFKEGETLHSVEILPAFYGLFGFVACVGLVYLSKFLGKSAGKCGLVKEEDYWEN